MNLKIEYDYTESVARIDLLSALDEAGVIRQSRMHGHRENGEMAALIRTIPNRYNLPHYAGTLWNTISTIGEIFEAWMDITYVDSDDGYETANPAAELRLKPGINRRYLAKIALSVGLMIVNGIVRDSLPHTDVLLKDELTRRQEEYEDRLLQLLLTVEDTAEGVLITN